MINLLPKSSEIIEQSIMFNESLKQFGYRSSVLIPKTINLPEVGYQQDVGYDYNDTIIAYVTIDPFPKPKLLQKLGWMTEDDDTKPMLVYLSRYHQINEAIPRKVLTETYIEVVPTKYTRFILEYDYNELGKEFIATKVTSNSFNPLYYILMIVPYRPTANVSIDPWQDNNVEIINIEETDNDFRFINERKEEVDIKY